MNSKSHRSQQGVVLIVSLLILLVLSIIGVSAISNTSMQERMSNNFQQSMVAFQANESTIIKTIMDGDKSHHSYSETINSTTGLSPDPLKNATNAPVFSTTTTVTYNADPYNHLNGVALTTTETVSYHDKTSDCPSGSSMGSVFCHNFELKARTTIAANNAGPTHVQGVVRLGP